MMRVYFPGLNGLRFIAAFMVFIAHIEWVKNTEGLPSASSSAFFSRSGDLGVTLFFVLSGFLITYLLLTEKLHTGSISIKHFYIRRILRIWPLYYLIVLLAFTTLPHFITYRGYELTLYDSDYFVKLFLFLFLMANVSYTFLSLVPFASPLWSVGVEEQFYLVWPVLVKIIGGHILQVLVTIVAVAIALNYTLNELSQHSQNNYVGHAKHFFQHFRIQCMAIGGIGAQALIRKDERLLRILYSTEVQLLAWVLAILAVLTPFNFGSVNQEVVSSLFMLIILNVSSNPKPIFSLENRILNYLGKISYGIYMYHLIALKLGILAIVHMRGFGGSLADNALFIAMSALVTLAMATLSYYFIEARFLALKVRFSFVQSNR